MSTEPVDIMPMLAQKRAERTAEIVRAVREMDERTMALIVPLAKAMATRDRQAVTAALVPIGEELMRRGGPAWIGSCFSGAVAFIRGWPRSQCPKRLC